MFGESLATMMKQDQEDNRLLQRAAAIRELRRLDNIEIDYGAVKLPIKGSDTPIVLGGSSDLALAAYDVFLEPLKKGLAAYRLKLREIADRKE